MYFEVSPVHKIPPQKIIKKTESEEVASLTLIPFSPNPKIFFENIPVGHTATRKLSITNPFNQDVTLFIKKGFPDDVNVVFSWTEQIIKAKSEVLLELLWRPDCEGGWRYSFTLSNGRQISRDIPVAFKATQSKKKVSTKSKVKAPTLLTTKLRSSAKKTDWKISPKKIPKRSILPNITNCPNIIITTPEKISMFFTNDDSQNGNNDIINRRETYTLTRMTTKVEEIVFNDSLEIDSSKSTPNKEMSFEKRLFESDSFVLSPVQTPSNHVQPTGHSTEEKSFIANNPKTAASKQICLFGDGTNATFDIPTTPANNETYVKGNISSRTYTKANCSSGTYVLEMSACDVVAVSPILLDQKSTSELSPYHQNLSGNNVKNIIEANLWGAELQQRKPLQSIKEESSYLDSFRMSTKRKSELTFDGTPSKRSNPSNISWSKCSSRNFKRSKKSSGLTIKKILSKNDGKLPIIQTETTTTYTLNNPLLSGIDPFMTSGMYHEPELMDEQENRFKKWLNRLLTPPTELETNSDSHPVNVVDLWKNCQKIDVAVAPSRETLSLEYHTNAKLDILRTNALKLFISEEMKSVLISVRQSIDNGKLMIRSDKDIHLDVGLQSYIMSILLSYNPLWLRIGLETVYNRRIPLTSNSDVVGLSTFLFGNFFKNNYLLKHYKTVHSSKYAIQIKRFILKKFFALVFFLDKAKTAKLIAHDPCLFCKNANIKESREVLLRFASETLQAIGDITRVLKHKGYVVQHKQTYIHEFDFAVNSLGVDLRDGVRLARVMEIILLRSDLTDKLRVPAISLLQKIHNTELVFDALTNAGFQITDDISPKDIVNGVREKTLSLLWQIIYKFEAPLLIKNVKIIQNWWRSNKIMKKRKSLREQRLVKENAANKIITWYKRLVFAKKLEKLSVQLIRYFEFRKKEMAIIKIQSWFRMCREHRKYLQIRKTVIGLQSYSRRWLVQNYQNRHIKKAVIVLQSHIRAHLTRKHYLTMKSSAIIIQRYFRAFILMKRERTHFLTLRTAILYVQTKYRSNKLADEQRVYFLELKANTILIQRRYRAKRLMQQDRNLFLTMKSAAIKIQNWYKSIMIMRNIRSEYLLLKHSVRIVENQYLSIRAMNQCRHKYEQLKWATIIIQQKYRANKKMEECRNSYLNLKWAAITVQRRFKANKKMLEEKEEYEKIRKAAIIIQKNYKAKRARRQYLKMKWAATVIQQRYGATKTMKECRHKFLLLQLGVVMIQRQFRANMLLLEERKKYQELRNATIIVQKNCRAIVVRRQYLKLKWAATVVQQKYRANKEMKECRSYFTRLKWAVVTIQRRFRANRLMLKERKKYQELKNASIIVQKNCRAILVRRQYLKLKSAATVIQQKYRANKEVKEYRNYFMKLKGAVLTIQRRFRANNTMLEERKKYRELRNATIIIQKNYRAILLRKQYLKLKWATTVVQQKYRANKEMKECRSYFMRLKWAAVTIQRRFRANRLMLEGRKQYQELSRATIVVQKNYRAILVRKQYLKLKWAATIVQLKYRANKEMKECRSYFMKLKWAVVTIQRRFRANILMLEERKQYQKLSRAAIIIQKNYRAKMQRNRYLKFKWATTVVQQKYRANREMKECQSYFMKLRWAVVTIQRRFRANKLMLEKRKQYQELSRAAIIIQKNYRAKIQRNRYLKFKWAITLIQNKWRAKRVMLIQRNNYLIMKQCAIFVQTHYRAKLLMRNDRNRFLALKWATTITQRHYKAMNSCRKERKNYLNLRNAVIIIQTRYRAYLQMKIDRKEFLTRKQTIIITQKYIRGYLIRKQYAYLLSDESKEQRRLEKLKNKAAIKIQALWRGYFVRSDDSLNTTKIRGKLKQIGINPNPNKLLHCRYTQAILSLSSPNITLKQIISVLEDLQYITRHCRDVLLQSNRILSHRAYITITCSSRSLPEMKACIAATGILINFAKFTPSRANSWIPEYIEKILTVMLHWCDKDSQLFPALCTLLWIFAHIEEYKHTLLNMPHFKSIMQQIRNLCMRKQKMATKREVKTLSVFGYYGNHHVPSLKPDWGLDYKGQPYMFQNSVHALNNLFTILNVDF